jgi:oxygen-dependent protoporphyrinogen oxidase
MKRVAIIGGGIAGLSAAYELAKMQREGAAVECRLFEANTRLGGIIETHHENGFTIECGPDAWVTEKPWARELAVELGLEQQLIASNDARRKTYIFQSKKLVAIPEGMRLMVPRDLEALHGSPLFSDAAKQAYAREPEQAEELKRSSPKQDESVAEFVRRHFGDEIVETLAAPLLSGIFGGDIDLLSVHAVMPQFVEMEREFGSLILGLRARGEASNPTLSAKNAERMGHPGIFTSLKDGLQTLIDAMEATLPAEWIKIGCEVQEIVREASEWRVCSSSPTLSAKNAEKMGHPDQDESIFDAVIVATPAEMTRELLWPLDQRAAELLEMDASSAVIVALGFSSPTLSAKNAEKMGHPVFTVPEGFGFLISPIKNLSGKRRDAEQGIEPVNMDPPFQGDQETHPDPGPVTEGDDCVLKDQMSLLACTFVNQKFDHRVPEGGTLLRAFFGGAAGEQLLGESDAALIARAHAELTRTLGPLPEASVKLVRRWPRSLPQYAVGHLERMHELDARVATIPGLKLIGNAYWGVGLPDLIRDGRAAAREL